MGVEYDGRKPFSRPRKLTEIEQLQQFQDNILRDVEGTIDEREELADNIYTDLAKTYLKGESLKRGLSDMMPAQYIPVEEFADSTRASANRIAPESSEKGDIITYGMFQKCVDIIMRKKWELRGTVVNMQVPASVEQNSAETSTKISNSNNPGKFLEEFIKQNGIVTTIIGMLTISPFQTVIFQALGVEQGAKGVQIAQIPAGIALFLELGIKAERILSILKAGKIDTPLVEQQIVELAASEDSRAEAMSSIGIDYNEFKKSQEFQDAEVILKYVSEYYQRYGGLDRPNGHLTIDHWIAYQNVAQNQQTIRDALSPAAEYSPKFKSYQDQFGNLDTSIEDETSTFSDNRRSKLSIQLASSTRALRERSDQIYNDIINSMSYYVNDSDLCCLVQIFGKIGNPDIMRTIASLLRILAANLSGEILRIQNLTSRFMANLAQDAMFKLMSDINKYYIKIVSKITKAFTVDAGDLTFCSGMFSMGWALNHAVRVLFKQLDSLLVEISSIIGEFGISSDGSWTVSADRRHLLGIARILEVLSDRLDVASACDRTRKASPGLGQNIDVNTKFDQAIFTILEEVPPVLTIPEEEKTKYFSNLSPVTSTNLKFAYGIASQQNNETNPEPCSQEEAQAKLDQIVANITRALDESFNG